jgi:hypothetical protein
MTSILTTIFKLQRIALAGALALTTQLAYGQSVGTVIFSENFDGLAGSLGPSVNERTGVSRVTRVATDAASMPVPNAFSHTGPAGWTIDNNFNAYGASVGNTGVPQLGNPEYGVDEWEGWSFARKEFWLFADSQTRETFTKASGNVAVADADEWDDLIVNPNTRQGFMNTNLITGNVNVVAHRGQTLNLNFDSSWRPEAMDDSHGNPAFNNMNNQAVVIAASFDGAAEEFLTFWDSNPGGGFFKGDMQNESISLPVNVPASATNVQFKFGYYNAANDWWWAIDNLALKTAADATVWSENFDAVPLGPSVNERAASGARVTVVETTPNTNPVPNAFTHTPPAGWNVDNSGGVPGVGNADEGAAEWEGWSFATPAFWTFADTQDRQNFTKGTGVVAIADPDEWDDLGNPEALGTYNSLLVTPAINIGSVGVGQLAVQFDSSWRDEDTQTAIIEVDYGNGFVPALRWESDSMSPFFHNDNANETVFLKLNNPAGATTARLRFGLINATDDWWWAVDNIRVGQAIPEPSTALLVGAAILALGGIGFRRRS